MEIYGYRYAFCAESGDNTSRDHLFYTQSVTKTRYCSPQIQNEIIETCGEIISSEIVSKINEAQSFSILGDKTTDIGGRLSSFRYVLGILKRVRLVSP